MRLFVFVSLFWYSPGSGQLQNANARDDAMTYTKYTIQNQKTLTARAVKEGRPSKAAKEKVSTVPGFLLFRNIRAHDKKF